MDAVVVLLQEAGAARGAGAKRCHMSAGYRQAMGAFMRMLEGLRAFT